MRHDCITAVKTSVAAQPVEHQSTRARWLRELCDFVRIPSVSAQPEHADDMRRCAHWLAAHLRQLGMERVQVAPTLCHPAMCAAVTAYQRGFGAPPVFLRSGGSIPIVYTLRHVLGIPAVLMGFALPDDRMHAPNEKFALEQFFRGIVTAIAFLQEIGAQATSVARDQSSGYAKERR